jgi:hypothetical protein
MELTKKLKPLTVSFPAWRAAAVAAGVTLFEAAAAARCFATQCTHQPASNTSNPLPIDPPGLLNDMYSFVETVVA